MTLEQAQNRIAVCIQQMEDRYGGQPVFDEWAIISLHQNKGRVLAYHGPRKDGFKSNFNQDIAILAAALLAGRHSVGDFEFARQAVGTRFEAFMVLGEGVYLICNNLVQTMDAIAMNPRWLSAQVPFVNLGDAFRDNPVEFAVPQNSPL